MENASKDVLFTIAMELDLPNLLRWCQSNSKINRNVCLNDNVWRSKLLKDFPDYEKFNLNRSLRETYVFMYQLTVIKRLLDTNESLYDIFHKKFLNLSNKGLNNVPAFDLPKLKSLYLSGNNLTKVPKFDLPNLQGLYLADNMLTEVPKFDFPKLEVLVLSYNRLTQIPEFDLPNLQELYVQSNQLTEKTKQELKEKYGLKVQV